MSSITHVDALQDRLNLHTERVEAVAAAGGTIPKPYSTALARWREWANDSGSDAHENLRQAYEDGADSNTLAVLRQAALIAEAITPVHRANVRNTVLASALGQLTVTYKPAASKNYETIRAKFNEAAAKFHAVTETVDVDADPAKLVAANDTTRTAWLDADLIARDLDTLTAVLADAARLAGKTITKDTGQIGLTVNAKGLHRRRVWEAWASSGRTGKWGALVSLGATIQAPALDDVKPYREPKPMETQYVRGNWGLRQVEIDPEDTDPGANVELGDGEHLVTRH